MRNTICTSILALGLAGAACAQTDLREGCYIRDYSDAHLAAHPAQVVDWIRVKIGYDAEYDMTYGELDALFADQGHVKGTGFGGQVLAQWLICFEGDTGAGCAVECDGGSFRVVKNDATTLTFRTENLWVGDTEGCGGAVDLAEVPGQAVTYRLDRVDDGYCEGN